MTFSLIWLLGASLKITELRSPPVSPFILKTGVELPKTGVSVYCRLT